MEWAHGDMHDFMGKEQTPYSFMFFYAMLRIYFCDLRGRDTLLIVAGGHRDMRMGTSDGSL